MIEVMFLAAIAGIALAALLERFESSVEVSYA